MENVVKKSAEEVAALKAKAERLQEEAARAVQEAALAAQEHAMAAEEHALAHGEPLPVPVERAVVLGEREVEELRRKLPLADMAGAMYYNGKASLELGGEELGEDEALLSDVLAAVLVTTGHINLTPAQRRSLLGSGVRRLGFILKVMETAEDMPEFIPPFFNLADMKRLAGYVRVLRNMRTLAQMLDRAVMDALLVAGHDAFQLALMYYSAVKDAARRGVKGAQELLNTLDLFFRRGRQADREPSVEEVEKDVRALLKGRKDGKIIVEHLAGLLEKGKTVVVDEAHKANEGGAFKETEEGKVE